MDLEIYLTASLSLDLSNVRFTPSTQTEILIRQLACANIKAKQELARVLGKNRDLIGALRSKLGVP